VVDPSANITTKFMQEGGMDAVMHFELAKGASPLANHKLQKAQKEIFGDNIDNVEFVQSVDKYLIATRLLKLLERNDKYELPSFEGKEMTRDQLISTVKRYGADNNIKVAAQKYFDHMSSVLEELNNEGLLTKQEYEGSKAMGPYVPISFINDIIDGVDIDITNDKGKKVSVTGSGLHKIKGGARRLVEMDTGKLLANVLFRTTNRIARNKANKSLWRWLKNNNSDIAYVPDKQVNKKTLSIKMDKEGNPKYNAKKKGYTRLAVTGVEGAGKISYIDMKNEYVGEWITMDPQARANQRMWLNAISWVSGSRLTKFFATGVNPAFAVYNFAIDSAFQWLTTTEYSSFLPLAGAQRAIDVSTVLKDSILGVAGKKSPRYEAFMKEGGGMNYLAQDAVASDPNRLTGVSDITSTLGKLQKVGAYLNEVSEIANRLALRERALKNGKTGEQATWVARTYLDFAQGGDKAKMVDSGIPYLNATIQATRNVGRAAIGSRSKKGERGKDVARFWSKGAQVMGMGFAMAWYTSTKMKDLWEQISPDEKNRFWILPVFGLRKFDDKTGKSRYMYVKIRKDNFQRILSAIGEEMAIATMTSGKADMDRLMKSSKEMINFGPVESMPPTLKAIAGYYANWDWWRDKQVWQGDPNIEPYAEHYKDTHPALKATTDFLAKNDIKLSPERLGFVIEQFVTSGNAFAQLFGEVTEKMMTDIPKEDQEVMWQMLAADAPVTERIFSYTKPEIMIRDKKQEKVKADATNRKTMNDRHYDRLDEYLAANNDRKMEDGIEAKYQEDLNEWVGHGWIHETDMVSRQKMFIADIIHEKSIDLPTDHWIRKRSRELKKLPNIELRASLLVDFLVEDKMTTDVKEFVEYLLPTGVMPKNNKGRLKFLRSGQNTLDAWRSENAVTPEKEAQLKAIFDEVPYIDWK
jgi:hypothetical protein